MAATAAALLALEARASCSSMDTEAMVEPTLLLLLPAPAPAPLLPAALEDTAAARLARAAAASPRVASSTAGPAVLEEAEEGCSCRPLETLLMALPLPRARASTVASSTALSCAAVALTELLSCAAELTESCAAAALALRAELAALVSCAA